MSARKRPEKEIEAPMLRWTVVEKTIMHGVTGRCEEDAWKNYIKARACPQFQFMALQDGHVIPEEEGTM